MSYSVTKGNQESVLQVTTSVLQVPWGLLPPLGPSGPECNQASCRIAMELQWISLLLVAACVSIVQGFQEKDVKEASINISQPLHIVKEGNLLVLTPAGLTQMLNQTRFLMVIF
ncbi:protein disulfide-isomerase-like protein of the testis [Crocuta crocuta]